jgi:hypothetical protein
MTRTMSRSVPPIREPLISFGIFISAALDLRAVGSAIQDRRGFGRG